MGDSRAAVGDTRDRKQLVDILADLLVEIFGPDGSESFAQLFAPDDVGALIERLIRGDHLKAAYRLAQSVNIEKEYEFLILEIGRREGRLGPVWQADRGSWLAYGYLGAPEWCRNAWADDPDVMEAISVEVAKLVDRKNFKLAIGFLYLSSVDPRRHLNAEILSDLRAGLTDLEVDERIMGVQVFGDASLIDWGEMVGQVPMSRLVRLATALAASPDEARRSTARIVIEHLCSWPGLSQMGNEEVIELLETAKLVGPIGELLVALGSSSGHDTQDDSFDAALDHDLRVMVLAHYESRDSEFRRCWQVFKIGSVRFR